MAGRLRLVFLAGALAIAASALGRAGGGGFVGGGGVAAGPPALAVPAPAQAQSLPVRLLDEDRLLRESELGRLVLERVRAAEQALEEENRRIADQLAAEEQELTDARAELSPEEFRARADAFDLRVEEIRAERAQRNEELTRFSEGEVQRFFDVAFPVVVDLMNDEGVVAILQPEAVIVALEAFDITGEAVARLDFLWREATYEGDFP
ncbi:MAG: OmpH family outer membrane protein [Pararhodobacter sp.]|nr:OmpH family outer membrane protein [Pararhodobacter sp.]